jgi:Protein of unknown function (DUF3800)
VSSGGLTPRRLYRVWIDETGDRGNSPTSSPFFGFAAAIIRAEWMDQLQRGKAEINRQLERASTHELHWSKNLKDHEKRHTAAEEVGKLPLRFSYAVIEKASLPPGAHMGSNKDALYNYAMRLLLERVSWLVDEANGEATITLASVSGLPARVPRAYIELLRRGGRTNQVRWNAIHPKIEVRHASTRDGLQVADIAAGALDRAIRPHQRPPHRMEPAYLMLIASRIYVRTAGKIASYGLKALPRDLWARFPWWREASQLPRNV